MPEVTFVSQEGRESCATRSKKVLGTRNHIDHAKSKKYSKIWNYHIFAGPKNRDSIARSLLCLDRITERCC